MRSCGRDNEAADEPASITMPGDLDKEFSRLGLSRFVGRNFCGLGGEFEIEI